MSADNTPLMLVPRAMVDEFPCSRRMAGGEPRYTGPSVMWDVMTGGQIQASNNNITLREFVFDLPRECGTEQRKPALKSSREAVRGELSR